MNNTTNAVTQRFIKCHNKLREMKVIKSSRQFAIELEYLPQSFSEILKGRRDVTIELLRKAVELYGIDANYIFTGDGKMFTKEFAAEITEKNNIRQIAPETPVHIKYVPLHLQKKFCENDSENNLSDEALPVLSLPVMWLNHEKYLCFDMSDDQMQPTLFQDDRLICHHIDIHNPKETLTGGHLYAFVLSDGIYVRRFHYSTQGQKKIVLTTDSLSQTPIEWERHILREVWRVQYILSRKSAYPKTAHLSLNEEIKRMNEVLNAQIQSIENLNQIIQTSLRK